MQETLSVYYEESQNLKLQYSRRGCVFLVNSENEFPRLHVCTQLVTNGIFSRCAFQYLLALFLLHITIKLEKIGRIWAMQ